MALTSVGELPANARVSVDSAPIIYFLEDHPKLAGRFAPVFDAAAQGALWIFVSTITLAEVVAGPLKAGHEILAAQYCEALRGSKNWELIPVDGPANDLICQQMRTWGGLRILSSIVGIAALAYVIVCAYLWHVQRHLVFLPEALVDRTPADAGLEFVEVAISVANASAIAAWWLPRGSADTQSAVVLYLHGNDGNLARELRRLQVLHRYALPILAIDYRGYGRSTGPFPSEAQVYDDAASAWNYLVHVRGIEPARIVIYGHSLGAAVAVELALRHGPACGVVLESAFASMADMARLEHPWIPVDLHLNQRFDVLRKIGRLEVPIVLVHGRADREVPSMMSERLYGAAQVSKRLVLVDGAGHEDAIEKGGEPLERVVAELARSCAR